MSFLEQLKSLAQEAFLTFNIQFLFALNVQPSLIFHRSI